LNKNKSKLNFYNACTLVLFVQALFLCAPAFAEFTQKQTAADYLNITELLLEAESKRLSEPKMFADELKSLEQYSQLMSDYQSCHFRFLKNYELSFRGKYQEATESLEQLLEQCEDPRVRTRISAMLANIFVIGGQFEKSINQMDAVIENASQTDDKTTKIMAYSVASIVYNLLKQTELSSEYIQLLYQIDPSPSNLCKVDYYHVLSALINDNESYDFDRVQKIADQCFATNNSLNAYNLLLKYYKFLLLSSPVKMELVQSIDESLSAFEKAIVTIGYRNIKAMFYAIKSLVALKLNRLDEAESLANQALEINHSIGDSEQYIIALSVLEQVSLKRTDFAKSYEYLKLKSDTEKKMFDLNQSKQIAFMTVKHSNLAKTFEIEQLNQRSVLLALEKQLADEKANNQRLVIIIIMTLMGLLIVWALRIKKKHDYFRDVSEIDHLTKVYTRKAFEEQAKVLLLTAHAQNKPVHVAIMDLDHFKNVNDNHGHLVGDWVLKNVVYACKQLIEEDMIIARLGGEEFCIVYANVEDIIMRMKLEDMRVAIEKMDGSESGVSGLLVTASFGVCSNKSSGYRLSTLLKHADEALFLAKNRGRNQVVDYQQKDA